jgi:hypothetical protein
MAVVAFQNIQDGLFKISSCLFGPESSSLSVCYENSDSLISGFALVILFAAYRFCFALKFIYQQFICLFCSQLHLVDLGSELFKS